MSNLNLSKSESTDFEKVMVPVGLQHAVITEVVALGEQETKWGPKQQVWIGLIFPELLHNFGEELGDLPLKLGNRYTNSFHEKSQLYKLVSSLVPNVENFDLENLIGMNCYVSIQHSEDGKYSNMVAFNPLPKEKEQYVSGMTIFYDGSNPEQRDLLPEWMQKAIMPF